MDGISTPVLLVLSGLGLGAIMGATARAGRFCTFGAVEDCVLARKTLRLKAWALAIAVAMICVQILHHSDLARIDKVFYLSPSVGLAGAVVGGFLFGLGMSMVGTCGYGIIVRLAGGDLKALWSFLILGFTGYMTARGLTSLIKVYTVDSLTIDTSGIGGQGLPHLLSWMTGIGSELLWLPVGLAVGGALLVYCLKDSDFRHSRRDVISGTLIGLAVAGGFLATGVLGADPFNEVRVHSLTYVLPLGETLVWLMTFTGSSLTFAISVVIGTFFGAIAVAIIRKEIRWEGFDDMREMRRHMLGAAAMGAGGVTALGCTVGQGISGVSTLAISPIFSLVSIFLGGTFGLYWLLTGSTREAWQMFFGGMSGKKFKVRL